MPAPLRFTCDAHTLTITDTHTGERIQCASLMEMLLLRGQLEIEHQPAKATSPRKAARIEATEQARQSRSRS